MRQYLLEVAFADHPAGCWAVRGEDERPLTLDAAGRVHLVDTDCTAGRTGIRWAWTNVRSQDAPDRPS
jgi:hypothetical protein